MKNLYIYTRSLLRVLKQRASLATLRFALRNAAPCRRLIQIGQSYFPTQSNYWLCCPAIKHLAQILNPALTTFEYGCCGGALFMAPLPYSLHFTEATFFTKKQT